MAELVTEIVGGESYQYHSLSDHIVRAIGVCGARPTFKYTRIEVTGVLERLAAGRSLDQLVEGYRGRVSREAILEGIMLVSRHFSQTLPELAPAS